jgi:hypothetical protein
MFSPNKNSHIFNFVSSPTTYWHIAWILPITSAEPALLGVYAVDLLSKWRALRGFRKTLEDGHD